VENTKKITKAMEMVAASKMRKAQDRMRGPSLRREDPQHRHPPGEANPEYKHPFMKANDAKRVGVIVVTTDKGLCGGMNTNVLRAVTNKLRELQAAGGIEAVAIGNKGLGFLNRVGAWWRTTQLGDTPHLDKLIGPVKVCWTPTRRQAQRRLPRYTRFINTMKQESVVEQLLPLSSEPAAADARSGAGHAWDYIYEPDAPTVIDELLCATSRRWSTRPWPRTWRPSSRRAWWP
jgi:F-type H+-transporting ATPase subunit gamma